MPPTTASRCPLRRRRSANGRCICSNAGRRPSATKRDCGTRSSRNPSSRSRSTIRPQARQQRGRRRVVRFIRAGRSRHHRVAAPAATGLRHPHQRRPAHRARASLQHGHRQRPHADRSRESRPPRGGCAARPHPDGGLVHVHLPVVLDADAMHTPEQALRAARQQLRRIPADGLGYALLRYLSPTPPCATVRRVAAGRYPLQLSRAARYRVAAIRRLAPGDRRPRFAARRAVAAHTRSRSSPPWSTASFRWTGATASGSTGGRRSRTRALQGPVARLRGVGPRHRSRRHRRQLPALVAAAGHPVPFAVRPGSRRLFPAVQLRRQRPAPGAGAPAGVPCARAPCRAAHRVRVADREQPVQTVLHTVELPWTVLDWRHRDASRRAQDFDAFSPTTGSAASICSGHRCSAAR